MTAVVYVVANTEPLGVFANLSDAEALVEAEGEGSGLEVYPMPVSTTPPRRVTGYSARARLQFPEDITAHTSARWNCEPTRDPHVEVSEDRTPTGILSGVTVHASGYPTADSAIEAVRHRVVHERESRRGKAAAS